MTKTLLTLCFLLCATSSWAFDFDEAGKKYGVNPLLLQAISWVESSYNNDAVNTNTNGSQDVCHMQINSIHKSKLGPGWEWLKKDPSYCTMIGAWILASCQSAYGNSWDAVSCYNTGRGFDELTGYIEQYRKDGFDTSDLERRRDTGLAYASRVQATLEALKKQDSEKTMVTTKSD